MTAVSLQLEPHRGVLFGVCYRMLGEPAEAHDVVQDTFVRALEKPPKDLTRSLRPWLVTVASRLCIDRLRRRKRRAYVGPWLPGPCDTDALVEEERDAWGETPERRVELRESATMAFLLALESCTPNQRAVLVLRDVFGLSTKECAGHLDMSESNVKVTLHRARTAVKGDGRVGRPRVGDGEAVASVLGQMMAALVGGDQETLVKLLRADVEALSDGAGEVLAAKVPLLGRERVMLFFTRLAQMHAGKARATPIRVNGSTGLLISMDDVPEGWPSRSVLTVDLDEEGRVCRVYSQLAPAKLAWFD